MLDNVIGVEEASRLWGFSPGYIKNLCAEAEKAIKENRPDQAKIICKKIGKTWIIDKEQPNPSKK